MAFWSGIERGRRTSPCFTRLLHQARTFRNRAKVKKVNSKVKQSEVKVSPRPCMMLAGLADRNSYPMFLQEDG